MLCMCAINSTKEIGHDQWMPYNSMLTDRRNLLYSWAILALLTSYY